MVRKVIKNQSKMFSTDIFRYLHTHKIPTY